MRRILGYFILFAIMMTSQILAGTDYYVDAANGNDANPGTESLPWQTVQKAANTIVAGDSVIVKAGKYTGKVYESTNGSPGSFITYQASGTVETEGFTISGDYIRVEGFNCSIIGECWTENTIGIYVDGDYCEIEDNYIYNCSNYGIMTSQNSNNCIIR
ncbi:unnamed protein product, partial [marine sediment metagenome]